MKRVFKVALIQNKIFDQKNSTLDNLMQKINEASNNLVNICILSECFNSFYSKNFLIENSENFEDSYTINALKKICKEKQIYIIGSIPEKQLDKYYNTAILIDKQGNLKDTYRKIHLFDIDIKDKITYKESGKNFNKRYIYCRKLDQTIQNRILQYWNRNMQYSILKGYDIRFPEFAQILRYLGADILCYPGAFNTTTGPMHWELLLRARSVDQQCFVCGVSSAQYEGDDKSIYKAWGHSMIVNPKGEIIVQTAENESILYSDIDLNLCDEQRNSIPTSFQKRNDIYQIQYLQK